MPPLFLEIKLDPVVKASDVTATSFSNKHMLKPTRIKVSIIIIFVIFLFESNQNKFWHLHVAMFAYTMQK